MNLPEYRTMYINEERGWWYLAKRRYAAVYLTAVCDGGPDILDVGCGTGKTTEFLGSFGRTSGVDISEEAVRFCRKRNLPRIYRASAMKLPFPNNSFRVVTMFDMLYHRSVSVGPALREARRVLRPHGHLLVTDCSHQFLFGPHDRRNQARQRFSKTELTGLIESAGFTVVRQTYLYAAVFPLFLVTRLWEKFTTATESDKTVPPPVNRALAELCSLEAPILSRHALPFGSSVMVLARKTEGVL